MSQLRERFVGGGGQRLAYSRANEVISLKPGFEFCDLAADRSRLRITIPEFAAKSDGSYQEGAVIPREAWRRPNSTEVNILKTRIFLESDQRVAVLNCESQQILALRRRALETCKSCEYTAKVFDVEAEEAAEVLETIIAKTNLTTRDARCLGVFALPPNHTTVTMDSQSGRRIGLHIDSFYALSHARETAPGRICVNLGLHSRHLLVVNQPFSRIEKDFCSEGGEGAATDIARTFLRCFRYPIISIEIKPLEAYIAPTENIIHDASTVGNHAVDIVLTVLGRFCKV
jgi:hypothetical protein